MTPEEQLDHLIEHWERSTRLWPVECSESVARLAAAEVLMQQLEALVVPPAFAARTESRVRARTQSLAAVRDKVIPFPRSQGQRRRRQRLNKRNQAPIRRFSELWC